jgi:enoyl-CoA hydratase/carnithine racemase
MLGFMRRLISLPIPTVAAINGHAFAGGAFVTLGCDYRVMRADKGWFCISEVDVGVPIGDPMMGLLKAKLSPQIAREAALTGKRYPAQEALAVGIVDAISEEDALLDNATALATSMAGKERVIFGLIKKQLYADVIAGFPLRPLIDTGPIPG